MIELRVVSTALATASRAARAGVIADLAFCHPAIRGVTAVEPDTVVLAVEDDSAAVRELVERVVELSVRSYRFVPPAAPLWQNGDLARYAGGLPALAAFIRDYTIELGPGQYALVGPAAQLRTRISQRLAALAEGVGAEPWHLPSIEQTADLIPATGYLAASAQYVTFGYRLPCHFDELRRFSVAAREQRLERPADPRDLEPTGFVLEPFVCHNVYRSLRGAQLARGRTITALGTCYRHESFRFEPLLRQWEFSMREVVMAGTADYVAGERARVLAATQDLVAELDLAAHIEVATDPFFVSEAGSARTYQAMHATKLEVVLALAAETRTAGCSVNSHGTHFTEPMRITLPDGSLAETACVGWGLERWMAAVVARWGADPAQWPESLR